MASPAVPEGPDPFEELASALTRIASDRDVRQGGRSPPLTAMTVPKCRATLSIRRHHGGPR